MTRAIGKAGVPASRSVRKRFESRRGRPETFVGPARGFLLLCAASRCGLVRRRGPRQNASSAMGDQPESRSALRPLEKLRVEQVLRTSSSALVRDQVLARDHLYRNAVEDGVHGTMKKVRGGDAVD